MSADTAILDHYLVPLRRALEGPGVTELVVNRPGEFAVESADGWRWIEDAALTAEALERIAVAAAAATRQDVTADQPICSTVLPTGERCQIVLPPAAAHVSLTLRKPAAVELSLDDLDRAEYFAPASRQLRTLRGAPDLEAMRAAGDWRGFFTAAVRQRRNILISGATGSGKTTFAKTLIGLIPPDERLVTIEDTRELTVSHRNAVHLVYAKDGQGVARIGPRQLLESALRMRPDRILMQELRDASAYYFLRNVNTGHPGSITTIHANSPALAFEQLILLVKESEAGRDIPRGDIHHLLTRLIDVVVQVERVGASFHLTEVWHEPDRQRAVAA